MTTPDPSPPTVLTEEEREALEAAHYGMVDTWPRLCAAVERIVGDRVAAAVQAERERIGGRIATLATYEVTERPGGMLDRIQKSPAQMRREAEAIARGGQP